MFVALVVIVIVLVCLLALAAGAALRARGAPAPAPERAVALPAEAVQADELAASLEPDTVLARALEAAVALPGVDGAVITLGAGPERTTLASGLEDGEIERAIVPLPERADLRALEVTYHHRAEAAQDGGPPPPRSVLIVALRAHGELIGSLAALSRADGGRLPSATAQELDALAHRAGPAIANARRYSEARELAELDSLTGLHNRRLFYDFLGREIARGQRYERFLSLIVFDLDDFKRINDRLGHLGGDAVLAELADRVRGVVRATDIACRVGGDEFAIILPESSREDAELLADRIARAIASPPLEKAGPLGISAGVAELRRDDTAAELFKRADQAMYRAKHAGKARTVAH